MGTSFQSWNPDHPTGNYAGFVKSCLRGIAAGLGVSYNMIANDLEGVNYSSIRAGLLDEREYYKAVQRWYIDSLIAPVFSGWLETNILNGTINLPSAKMSKFNSPGVAHWMPRRWAWVDPLKDQQASVLAVENQFKSKRQVVAEMGSTTSLCCARSSRTRSWQRTWGWISRASQLISGAGSVTQVCRDYGG